MVCSGINMAIVSLSSSSILYQNSENTVFLIDIPTSIQEAQGVDSQPCTDRLFSAQPMQKPFSTNEPKSQAAVEKIQQNTVDAELHAYYAQLIREALVEIQSHWQNDWCLTRFTAPMSSGDLDQRSRKRKSGPNDRRSTDSISECDSRISLPSNLMQKMTALTRKSLWRTRWPRPLQHLCQSEGTLLEGPDDPFYAIANTEQTSQDLAVSDKELPGFGHERVYSFQVPPLSTFMLSDIKGFGHLHESVAELERQKHELRRFDIILMDPPWPNASAKRRSGYKLHRTLADMKTTILSLQLDSLLKEQGHVGVWITNKPSLRDSIVGEDGLFGHLELQLVEEWVWIKTTTNGQPITSLDSLWRKPYEILLLGRRMGARQESQFNVKSRVIAGVPDLHSRKPCLKKLMPLLVPDARNYLALELFARHLTSEWWSWGDEVLKFNWKGFWSSSPCEADSSG
ncbi:MT-A70-domain-containing protein [Xylona heveae TC161]|uniref:MT-A70-domain-containing protein n=1 Tax=Xylona heveae (strain CBS 132557 / TC161) TaxID=1328760 RepID=A0A165H9L6_XYLHT|nr:MT-A70-domain-containing protein [Xylona heveae TC161]KZF23178.1 MT-A70-domain-containing protein [Xylona heveae TC161]